MQSTESLIDPRKLRDPPSARNVKLVRTSSARPLLYSKNNNEMLNRLAVIIQDSKNIDDTTTKGKLPVEAAYTVMKRVTEAAGEPLIPTGLSTFNKLQSLRTDPALKVLKTQPWKAFFKTTASEQDSPDNNKGRRSSVANGKANTSGPGDLGGQNRKTSKDIAAQQQAAILERVFANLIVRIEDLWDQLRIPSQERQFYHKTAFRAVVDSYEPCKNLALYIEMLELHKDLTKDVIFAIHAREEAVKKCYDTLGAIRRKLQRISQQQVNNGVGGINGITPGQRPSSASATMRASSSTPTLTDAQIVDESGRMAFWKEELIISLDEVRCATLEVIKAIQQWRRILWRPHAFVWCGINYFYKMQEDMNVLETDIYKRILSMVPLSREDILCVIFSPAANTTESGEPVQQGDEKSRNNSASPTNYDNNNNGSSNRARSLKANEPTRSSFSQTSSSRESIPRSNSRSPSRRGSNGRPRSANGSYHSVANRQRLQQQHEKIDAALKSLLETFHDNIDLVELHAAARVVIDEYKLQQAIQTEKEALHFKGVFIPLLKARKDLRDDDLSFYNHQHIQAQQQQEVDRKENTSSSQRPFSPDKKFSEEELYEPAAGRPANNNRYEMSSTDLEPSMNGDYQSDFYDN